MLKFVYLLSIYSWSFWYYALVYDHSASLMSVYFWLSLFFYAYDYYHYYWYQLCVPTINSCNCLISMVYGPFIDTFSCRISTSLVSHQFLNNKQKPYQNTPAWKWTCNLCDGSPEAEPLGDWNHIVCFYYNPKSEKVGTVWKTQIKKESSDF